MEAVKDPASRRPEVKARSKEVVAAIRADAIALRDELQDATRRSGQAQDAQLAALASCERARLWEHDGARDAAQWVSAQLGISNWKARRMLHAGRALEELPSTRAALRNGSLSLDKVLELARFATPGDEDRLVPWARRITTATVRARADEACRKELEQVRADHEARSLSWWMSGDEYMFEGRLPAEQGAAVTEAIDRLARDLPGRPDESHEDAEGSLDARRADALYLLTTSSCKGKLREPLVVLHAPIEALVDDDGNATVAGGPVLHPETARRIACDANLQVVLEDAKGNPIGIGRASRVTPRWLRRLVARKGHDRCGFRGCERKTHLQTHHVRHWSRGGATDEDNLVMLCSYHHWLVHEAGWSVSLQDGVTTFFRPSGRIYEPGVPEPPELEWLPDRTPRMSDLAGYSSLMRMAETFGVGTN